MYQGHLHHFMIVSVVMAISALACNVIKKRGTNPTQPPVNHQPPLVLDLPPAEVQSKQPSIQSTVTMPLSTPTTEGIPSDEPIPEQI